MIYQCNPLVSYSMGGGKRYVQSLISNYIKNEIPVTVIGAQTDLEPDTTENEFLSFIPIVHTDDKWIPFFIKLFMILPFMSISNGSVFHIHRTYFALPFIFFKRNFPLVCTVHGLSLDEMKLRKPLLRRIIFPLFQAIEKYCLKRINSLIAVNQQALDLYKERHPHDWLDEKSKIMPAGVELDLFQPMDRAKVKEKYGMPLDDKVILFVGRLDKCKNIEFIINSFSRTKAKENRAKLLIVGRGTEKDNLLNLSNQLNLDDSVSFWGEINHSILPEIMNCANVLVLSSYFEASPIVIKESLSCGIPVVTLNVGDVKLWITNDLLGKIIETRDEKLFAESICEYLAYQRSNYDIHREATKVLQSISWEIISKKYLEIYHSLLNLVDNKAA